MSTTRANVLIAATKQDALTTQKNYPQFRYHLALYPGQPLSAVRVREYVWTPTAAHLPARQRLALRGVLAPLIDEMSVEEEFPDTLLSW